MFSLRVQWPEYKLKQYLRMHCSLYHNTRVSEVLSLVPSLYRPSTTLKIIIDCCYMAFQLINFVFLFLCIIIFVVQLYFIYFFFLALIITIIPLFIFAMFS